MTSKGKILTGIILVVILIMVFNTVDVKRKKNKVPPVSIKQMIVLKHYYNNNIEAHTYSGSILMPTPCYSVSLDSMIAESYPEQVTILMVTDPITEYCARMTIPLKFGLNVTASRVANLVGVFLDGNEMEYVLEETNIVSEAEIRETENHFLNRL